MTGQNRVTDAVVPVAGLGTRLLPATRAVPKELLPLGGRPVIDHVLDELEAAGIERVVLVTRTGKEAIEQHLAGARGIEFAHQRQPRGLGDAIRCANLRGPAVCALGDAVIRGDVTRRLLAAFAGPGVAAAVAVQEVPAELVERYGIVAVDDDGRVGAIVEKPRIAEAPSRLAIAARYVLGPAVFEALDGLGPGAGGEVQLTDALAQVVAAGLTVVAVRLEPGERRLDIGSPASYAAAFAALAGPGERAAMRAELADGEAIAFARAALAGNPSDGYGGAVLAVCVRDHAATATITPGDGIVMADPSGAQARFGGLEELLAAPCAAAALVHAAVKCLARAHPLPPAGWSLRVSSTIPREVGLAGSSAIVVASLRALAEHARIALDRDTLPALALAAETEELGIAAGLQDRVVQVRGGLVQMDFATGAHEDLDPALLPPLYLAWIEGYGAPSGVTHRDLRTRFEHGESLVQASLQRLAGLARQARDALVAGDAAAFAAAVDGSYDARAAMLDLDPRLTALVACARSHGASANFSGSGGAIVGTRPADDTELRGALERLGCSYRHPTTESRGNALVRHPGGR